MPVRTYTLAELLNIDPREVKAMTLDDLVKRIYYASMKIAGMTPEVKALLAIVTSIADAALLFASVQDVYIEVTKIIHDFDEVVHCFSAVEWQQAASTLIKRGQEQLNLFADNIISNLVTIVATVILNTKVRIIVD